MKRQVLISNASNLLPFINYFDLKGINWKEVARELNFPEDVVEGNYWLPTHHLMAFLSKMLSRTDIHIGFEVGRRITVEQLSPELNSLLDRCENLESGISKLMAFIPKINNHVVIWPQIIDGKWFLCHRGMYHPSQVGFDQAEWFRSFLLLSFCRRFLGEGWKPRSVKMCTKQHLSIELPTSILSEQLEFSSSIGAIELPLQLDYVPVKLPEPERWLETVNSLMGTYAVLPKFNIHWLAELLGTSSRTLQRHFKMHNVQFRNLRDIHRCERAKQLLSNMGYTPSETAWRCGYTDLSNFNRAFLGWTGMTPSQYMRSVIK